MSDRSFWHGLLAGDLVLLVLLGFSFLFVEPGTPSYVAAQLGFGFTLVTIAGLLVTITVDWTPFLDAVAERQRRTKQERRDEGETTGERD